MLPVTKPNDSASTAAKTSKLNTETSNDASSIQNENLATTSTSISSDLDSSVIMSVCRICLCMKVKMYHLTEHGLMPMYEGLTKLEINLEDKLPQMLCWECAARLSSACRFKEKALKTHWILMNKANSCGNITINDIKSIDKAGNQLETTLGFKFYKVNDSNLHIMTQWKNETITQSKEPKLEVKLDIEDDYISDYTSSDEKDQKDKLDVINERATDFTFNEVDISFDTEIKSEAIDKNKGVLSIKEEHPCVYTPTLLKNQSARLPRRKELVVVLENNILLSKITHNSYKQLTGKAAPSTKDNKKPSPVKRKITFNDKNDFLKKLGNSTNTVKSPRNKMLKICNPINISQTIKSLNGNSSNLIRNDTDSPKQVFLCDHCGKPFRYMHTLKHHILKHTGSGVHQCTYCSYNTNNKWHLSRHINDKHVKTKTFNCSYCSFKTSQKASLHEHINCKHTKTKVFNCSYCSYKAYQKSVLRHHINSKHTEETVFNCSYCSYKAHQKSHLEEHINSKHTKNIVFECPFCSYKAYRKVHLSKHINGKHTKNVSFSCSYCSFKTLYKTNLNAHIKSQHSSQIANTAEGAEPTS